MNDHPVVLVLNAGSSSLKFSVYRISDGDTWHPEARGQIEGIGTSPRFSAKNGWGASLDDRVLDSTVHDAGTALEFLAAWLRGPFKERGLAVSAIAWSTAARVMPRRQWSRRQ